MWPVRWCVTGTRALAHRLVPLVPAVVPWRKAAASLLITGAAVLSACSGQAPPTRHVVEITGFAFVPDTLHAAVGDTVVWVNRDVVPHTATARDSSWDSGAIGTEASWTFVADSAGETSYICAIHPAMVGVIDVR